MIAFLTHVFIVEQFYGTCPRFFGFWRNFFIKIVLFFKGENGSNNPATIRSMAGRSPVQLSNDREEGVNNEIKVLLKVQKEMQKLIQKQKMQLQNMTDQVNLKTEIMSELRFALIKEKI